MKLSLYICVIAVLMAMSTGCATRYGYGKYDSSCGLYSCTDPCLSAPGSGCSSQQYNYN